MIAIYFFLKAKKLLHDRIMQFRALALISIQGSYDQLFGAVSEFCLSRAQMDYDIIPAHRVSSNAEYPRIFSTQSIDRLNVHITV